MDCETFRIHLGDWLDDRADARTRVALQAHSMLCRDCEQLRKVRVSLRLVSQSVNKEDAVPAFLARVLKDAAKADR